MLNRCKPFDRLEHFAPGYVFNLFQTGSVVVQTYDGSVEAHLFVSAVYTFLGLIGAAIFWAIRSRPTRAATPTALAAQREMQLIMLVMLGYTLARKAHRAS